MSDNDTSKIGYGSPPLHTRFQPGVSGNPKGRPKKKASLADALSKELNSLVTVNIGGKKRKIKKSEAIVKTTVQKAMQGDLQATKFILSTHKQIAPQEEVYAQPQYKPGIPGMLEQMKEIRAKREEAAKAEQQRKERREARERANNPEILPPSADDE